MHTAYLHFQGAHLADGSVRSRRLRDLTCWNSRALRRPYTTRTLKYFRITSTTLLLLVMVVSSRPQPVAFDECELQVYVVRPTCFLTSATTCIACHCVQTISFPLLFLPGMWLRQLHTNKSTIKAVSTGTNSGLFPSWCSTSSTRCSICESTLMVLCRSCGNRFDTRNCFLLDVATLNCIACHLLSFANYRTCQVWGSVLVDRRQYAQTCYTALAVQHDD